MSILKVKDGQGNWVAISSVKGDKGDTGEGIAQGGSTGQVLAKKSNTDYDTEWVNQDGGILDVKVNGASVVNLSGEAIINPKGSDIEDDSVDYTKLIRNHAEGTNYIDRNLLEIGYISSATGEVKTQGGSGFVHTPFIEIDSTKTYYTGTDYKKIRLDYYCWYDENKTPIIIPQYDTSTQYSVGDYVRHTYYYICTEATSGEWDATKWQKQGEPSFVVPSGAKYIRVSYQNNGYYDNCWFNDANSEPQPYAYTLPNQYVGSGGGGTTDYADLSNKPKINNVELSGNKSLNDLGIDIPTKTSDLTNDSGFLTQHQSLSGYATETWVENKGYLTSHQDISGKADKSNTYTKTETDSAISNYHDSTKQDTLVSATNIKTINNQSILGSGNIDIQSGGVGGTHYKSTNLYNKNDVEEWGYYINYQGTKVSDSLLAYSYIAIDGEGAYAFKNSRIIMGNNANYVMLYDANKNFLYYKNSTEIDTSGDYRRTSFSITSSDISAGATWMVINFRTSIYDNLMVVKSSTYPDTYIPYYDYVHIQDADVTPKHLFNKSIVFDGDSICNASSEYASSSTKYLGWAYRIGSRNQMDWYNYGIGGGTIAYYSGHYCISRNISTIITKHPTLDYFVFEGGTNDADLNVSLGSFTPFDFSGTYDDTTFCGAFEKLIYTCLNNYPHIKIGYIVAHKMDKGQALQNKRYSYFAKAMEICEKWGVPYINLWDNSQLNPNILSHYDSSLGTQGNRDAGSLYIDGQHLTSYGYDVISPKIEAFVEGLEGITKVRNTYTKTETDTLLGGKANTSTTYTKSEVDSAISTHHDSTKQDTLTAGQNITIVDNVISASGGGGGTSDYTALTNKPQINGVELSGNKSLADLGIEKSWTYKGSITADAKTLSNLNLAGCTQVLIRCDSYTGTDFGFRMNNKLLASSSSTSFNGIVALFETLHDMVVCTMIKAKATSWDKTPYSYANETITISDVTYMSVLNMTSGEVKVYAR